MVEATARAVMSGWPTWADPGPRRMVFRFGAVLTILKPNHGIVLAGFCSSRSLGIMASPVTNLP